MRRTDNNITKPTEPINPNRAYTIDEVADALSIAPRKIRNELADKKNGGIQYITIGKQFRILGENILSYLGSATYQGETKSSEQEYKGGAA